MARTRASSFLTALTEVVVSRRLPFCENDVSMPRLLQKERLSPAGVAAVATQSGDLLSEEFLGQLDTVYKSDALALNALKESFSMNDMPSTWMLLHLAPNSTVFVSLPRTIGRT